MSVRRSLAWAFSGQVATFLVNFLGSVVIARLLSPEEMGVYALALATAGILSVLGTFGIVSYIVREVDLSYEKIASAFTINAMVNTSLALATLAASFLTNLGNPNVALALRLLAIPPIIAMFEFRPFAMLQREMRFQTSSTIATLGTAINVCMTIAMAWNGFSSLSMPCGAIAMALFRAIAFNAVFPDHARIRVSFQDWRVIMVFGVRMITIRGAATLAQRASEIILGRMLGLTALGIYSRASILSSQIYFNIYGTATNVVFAELSRKYRETGILRDTFLRGLDMILAVMWPVLIGLAVLARPAICILYGPKWIEAALPLSLLMLAQVCTLAYGMNWELFVLRDETAKQTKYEIFRSFLGLVIFALGTLISLGAATLGRVLDSVLGGLIYLPQMTRLAGARPDEILQIYGRGAALSVAAVTPSFILMVMTGWSEYTSPLAIAGTVAAGGVLWLGLLRIFGHPLFDEFRRLLRVIPNRVVPTGG